MSTIDSTDFFRQLVEEKKRRLKTGIKVDKLPRPDQVMRAQDCVTLGTELMHFFQEHVAGSIYVYFEFNDMICIVNDPTEATPFVKIDCTWQDILDQEQNRVIPERFTILEVD